MRSDWERREWYYSTWGRSCRLSIVEKLLATNTTRQAMHDVVTESALGVSSCKSSIITPTQISYPLECMRIVPRCC